MTAEKVCPFFFPQFLWIPITLSTANTFRVLPLAFNRTIVAERDIHEIGPLDCRIRCTECGHIRLGVPASTAEVAHLASSSFITERLWYGGGSDTSTFFLALTRLQRISQVNHHLIRLQSQPSTWFAIEDSVLRFLGCSYPAANFNRRRTSFLDWCASFRCLSSPSACLPIYFFCMSLSFDCAHGAAVVDGRPDNAPDESLSSGYASLRKRPPCPAL